MYESVESCYLVRRKARGSPLHARGAIRPWYVSFRFKIYFAAERKKQHPKHDQHQQQVIAATAPSPKIGRLGLVSLAHETTPYHTIQPLDSYNTPNTYKIGRCRGGSETTNPAVGLRSRSRGGSGSGSGSGSRGGGVSGAKSGDIALTVCPLFPTKECTEVPTQGKGRKEFVRGRTAGHGGGGSRRRRRHQCPFLQ